MLLVNTPAPVLPGVTKARSSFARLEGCLHPAPGFAMRTSEDW